MKFHDLVRSRYSEVSAKEPRILDEIGIGGAEYYDLETYPDDWRMATSLGVIARLSRRLGIDLAEFVVREFPDARTGDESVPSDFVQHCRSKLDQNRQQIRDELERSGVHADAADALCEDPVAYSERAPIDGIMPILSALDINIRSLLIFLEEEGPILSSNTVHD